MNKKPRPVKLGKWQIAALNMILNSQVCCSHSVLSMVGGTAKKWDYRYKRSLKNAIEFHNNGRAINSPVPKELGIIEINPFSPSKSYKPGFNLCPRLHTPAVRAFTPVQGLL